MTTKRPADDDPNLVSKIQRVEHATPLSPQHRNSSTTTAATTTSNAASDFSGSVKKKLADSKRTGQACDRCKVRKIRCDGRPEGCTPCEQNRTPCRTTDRITGRATVRGHAEAMESENSYLRAHIADLQAQLKEHGIEPRPPPTFTANTLQTPAHPWSSASNDTASWPDASRRTSPSPLSGYAPAAAPAKPESLPQFKHGSIGDNYLGVAPGDLPLSHIKGTSLSIFGTDIDITDFMPGETEYEKEAMSYSTLIKIAMGGQPVETPQLPPYNELKEYAIWYLRSMNPYTMLVHKPAFMQLIWRIGNEPNFTPSASETVTVHMMLATITYQIAIRNSDQGGIAMLSDSHAHYHYSLTFFKQLVLGDHGWEDVRALTMICHHLRNFPRPGAAWIMTSIVYLFAIQLGLHRSVKVWEDDTGKLSKLDIEMRKRVFWTLNALQVNLNGRLGRPMPISNEDIDVEFPEPMNDCLPGEEAKLDTFHQCSFQPAIQIAKYTVWEVELYKTIYAVRHSTKSYEDNLKRLAAGIRQWKEELPYELRDVSHASDHDTIFTLYLECWYQSFVLLLHHPGICRSTDAALINSNLDKCLHAAQRMLHICKELMNKKSLDIPWINTVVYIAAAFTTLFISSTRQDQMTPSDMTKLKDDMASWVDVLGECDHFLGSGNRLKLAVSRIVDQSLSNINDSIVKRTATESLARVAMHAPARSDSNASASTYDQSAYQDHYAATTSGPTDPNLPLQSSTYTAMPVNSMHSYNLGAQVSVPSQPNRGYDQHNFNGGDETSMNPNHAAALAAAAAAASSTTGMSQPPTDAYTYSHAHAASNTHQQPSYTANGYAAQDWTQWTRAYMQQPDQSQQQPGDYLNTATTLMTLGRDSVPSHGTGTDGQGLVQTSGAQGHHHPHQNHHQHQHHQHHGQHTPSHHQQPMHWPQIAYSNPTRGSH